MRQKYLRKNEYQALLEFKNVLTQRFPKEILELKLFGSKARGNSHKESDIDILIVLKKRNKKIEDYILDLTGDLLRKYEILISPIIFSKKEYDYQKKLPSIFIQILNREAIPL